jgi:hypothetical protein
MPVLRLRPDFPAPGTDLLDLANGVCQLALWHAVLLNEPAWRNGSWISRAVPTPVAVVHGGGLAAALIDPAAAIDAPPWTAHRGHLRSWARMRAAIRATSRAYSASPAASESWAKRGSLGLTGGQR